MKLYTEEQVRLLLNEILMLSSSVDDAMDSLTPIELPSDEEIEKRAESYCDEVFSTGMIHGASNHTRQGYIQSAKWMKQRILIQIK